MRDWVIVGVRRLVLLAGISVTWWFAEPHVIDHGHVT
ncbi:hypothetical protein H4W32_000065 [Actinophytocola algeriensis]|uniref:Uncharacterized protein n=1 Tax=Actinophytocola algeriensis TaxID=1768010 RepID=A0A7W7VJN1_9PSEU|nr:hypothetical protein [Actinophytocola algeriensis]MBE1472023.1 hypothetical protein [Actinophytocola algeriensis]